MTPKRDPAAHSPSSVTIMPNHLKRLFMRRLRGRGWVKSIEFPHSRKTVDALLRKAGLKQEVREGISHFGSLKGGMPKSQAAEMSQARVGEGASVHGRRRPPPKMQGLA
jgi:hypothetical protein